MNPSKLANLIVRGVVRSFQGHRATVSHWAGHDDQREVEIIYPAGVASDPTGKDIFMFSLNSDSSRRFGIVTSGSSIIPEEGETVFSSPDGSSTITLSDAGITLQTNNLTINSGTFTWNGDRVAVAGDVDTAGHAIV